MVGMLFQNDVMILLMVFMLQMISIYISIVLMVMEIIQKRNLRSIAKDFMGLIGSKEKTN